jgi:hypothetical protein
LPLLFLLPPSPIFFHRRKWPKETRDMPINKSTCFSGGVAAGGTPEMGGWERTNQPTLLTVRVSQDAMTIKLPERTTVLKTYVFPDSEAPAATGGTVTMVDTTNAVVYLNAVDATSTAVLDVATPGQLPSDTTFTVTPTGVTSGEFSRVGLYVVLPETRR